MTSQSDAPSKELPEEWLAKGQVKRFKPGQRIIESGAALGHWVAISRGTAYLVSHVAPGTSVAVAALWLGDVIGGESPLGKLAARYDVTALVEVTTINIPLAHVPSSEEQSHTSQLYTATASRLQNQISMRLAGNGLQRLVSVMATLAAALAADKPALVANTFALPVTQSAIGQLSGLSRRQTWIYLGQLSQKGWVETARSTVTLAGIGAWLALMREVENAGIECIETIDQVDATLGRLSTGR